MAKRRWRWLLLLLPLAAAVGFVAWAEGGPGPTPEALAALASDAQVQVRADFGWAFSPVASEPTVGLAFYPGGRVDPRAYAPAARAVAAQGYLVVIVPVPLRLAVLAPDRATAAMAQHPQVQRWAVGGHSLGGAMAARYAFSHPQQVQGLALWAAYPSSSDDLSARPLEVVSIYGTLDGLAKPDKMEASRPLLPPGTRWAAIEGGNHAQFGWYGPQSGDNPASISPQAQTEQVVAATVDLLARLAARDR
ncbi:MAG: alpha/beta hydrolase [Chloroflexi bacterium]|nr:alpha/beta hydrolase [Chloroflexota bacterium]